MVRASFDFDVIGDPTPPRKQQQDQGAGATVDTHGLLVPTETESVHEPTRDIPRP